MTDYILEIDARGLLCPLPVLKLRKRLTQVPDGTTVRLHSDDPMAAIDVPHFCAENGHELVQSSVDGTTHQFLVKRGGALST